MVVIALCLLLMAAASAQELLVAPENGQGLYHPGETIRWTVDAREFAPTGAVYVLKKGGLTATTRRSHFRSRQRPDYGSP